VISEFLLFLIENIPVLGKFWLAVVLRFTPQQIVTRSHRLQSSFGFFPINLAGIVQGLVCFCDSFFPFERSYTSYFHFYERTVFSG
jgi:hypothetical protein